jgi:2-methylcitrate dehydratase PrpD
VTRAAENPTRRLARAAAGWRVGDPALRDRARLLLCDYLGVAAAGAGAASSVAAQRASGWRPGPALIEGTGRRADVADAALLNALAAHALELDDTHEPASLHPGVVIWPVALSLADELGSSCDAVLDAAGAGYDVVCTVGEMLGGQTAYRRGFHPTGVCGAFGGAAAAGRLLGLDAAGMAHALGIAGTTAAGSMEYLSDGAWTKRLNPAVAAVNGIRAARLAAAGFSGPATALEGPHGFLRSYGDERSAERAGRSGEPGAGIRSTSVKFYACCRYLHGIIDLLTDLAVRHQVRPGDVEAIGCGVLSGGWSLVAHPIEAKRMARSEVDAQFSAPFVAAAAVARRRVTLADFRRAPEVGRELGELMGRVECFASPALDAAYPGRWGAEAWIRLRDGTVLSAEEPSFRGSAEAPPSWDDIVAKHAALVGAGPAAELARRCRAFGGDAPAAEALAVRAELRDRTADAAREAA